KQWIRKKILDKVFKNVYRFLVTGKPGVERSLQLGIDPQRIVNFPFATNTNFFIPLSFKQTGEVRSKLTFLSSGRLDNAHKAFDLAIQAFELLKKNHPDLSFQYFIAGDGPDKGILTHLIQQKNLSQEVILKGWLEPIDLLDFYRSGDVFLHPSNFDPFPNAVLEAMSCGLPVIGSSGAGSVIDRISEGENGYIHQQGNVEEMYHKLLLIAKLSLEERNKMGIKSRETALKWDISYHKGVIKDIVEHYQS
ncbi:MAG TPA: glycosyltransferase, partial [Cytophagaceae bacterium]|nr:glycosyltransferase [Cytophagaceae bacterium]